MSIVEGIFYISFLLFLYLSFKELIDNKGIENLTTREVLIILFVTKHLKMFLVISQLTALGLKIAFFTISWWWIVLPCLTFILFEIVVIKAAFKDFKKSRQH